MSLYLLLFTFLQPKASYCFSVLPVVDCYYTSLVYDNILHIMDFMHLLQSKTISNSIY